MGTARAVVLTLLAAAAFAIAGAEDLARGWGNDIKWTGHSVASQVAKRTGRPVMYVVHKTWCGACNRLKPLFAASEDIARLSKEFVMVNMQDNEEPEDSQFKPDGGYIPRILFGGSTGRVDADIVNESGNEKYKYFYNDAAGIVRSMRSALGKYGPSDEL